MPHDASAGNGTFRLVYRSRNRLDPDSRTAELSDLFTQARSANKRRNVTGALLCSSAWFVQVLEGGEADVRAIFHRIEQDRRHDNVELLSSERVPGRVFGHWSMAKDSVHDDPDIPLIDTFQASPTTGRGITAEQDHLLGVMRDALSRGPAE